MNKKMTKMTYLIGIFIITLLATCIYSTYAIFTFEGETGDIVNIKTPNSLSIYTDTYEYKQIVIDKNTVKTIDVDIYNKDKFSKCYSVWWNIVTKNIDENLVSVMEQNEEKLTTIGTINQLSATRIKLIIINDNNTTIKINIGLKTDEQSENCNIKLNSKYNEVKEIYHTDITYLNDTIINYQEHQDEENYYIYKNNKSEFTYLENDKLSVANNYTYKDEIFILNNPEQLTLKEINETNKDYYYCKDEYCKILYKINKIEKREENDKIEYIITNYDYYEGYSKGISGVKKVDTDYYFYGDNPNNYIYYNCINNNLNTCEIWRIIGEFYNETTKEYEAKIIKNDLLETTKYGLSVDFTKSNIQEILNNYEISTKYISDRELYYDILTNNDLKKLEINKLTLDKKITILSLKDYINTSICTNKTIEEFSNECIKNNWLNRQQFDKEWTNTINKTIEKKVDDEENIQEIIHENIYTVGSSIESSTLEEINGIRPVIYLKSRTLILSGEGTFENPYVIK